jgi:hypothetical protein
MTMAKRGGRSNKKILIKEDLKMRKLRFKTMVLVMAAVLSTFIISLGCTSSSLSDDKNIVILAPKAGDVLKVGESYEIQWVKPHGGKYYGAMLDIELSTDGGKTWENIVGGPTGRVPNAYEPGCGWTPRVKSTKCKIKIYCSYQPISGTTGLFTVK